MMGKMNMNCKSIMISIIVPVYGVEPYICACVDSVLEQTYTNFELILVDDGSSDNCPYICDVYAEKDNRVHVIHQRNKGLSAARNAGISYAKGEYLCFVDSDDILSSDYCQKLLDAVLTANCKMAGCSVARFLDGEVPTRKKNDDSSSIEVTVIPSDDFLKLQMTSGVEMGIWNRLFHRSIFEKIRFMPGRLHEDIIFSGDLLAEKNDEVAYIDVPLYYYRQRSDSIVNQQKNSMKCSVDRVWAGEYLVECAKQSDYKYLDECLVYAIQYPWSFVDPIYVHFSLRKNRDFLNSLQKMIRDNREAYSNLSSLDVIQRNRMLLFSHSKILYGLNAYARLFRVYVYHILKLDAYSDGHGI